VGREKETLAAGGMPSAAIARARHFVCKLASRFAAGIAEAGPSTIGWQHDLSAVKEDADWLSPVVE